MGIREKMSSDTRNVTLGVAAIALLAVVAAAYQIWPARPTVGTAQSFYSDDDGKTYFSDSIFKFPPFDHNGKTAYRALVFKTDGGEPFVGVLQRYQPKAQKLLSDAFNQMQAGKKTAGEVEGLIASEPIRGGTESKLVGPNQKWRANWMPSPQQIKTPDGKAGATFVTP
ncbi:MAG: hypothetical protein ACTHLZ_11195 [Tepidisphaeraceae bacterium]